MKLLFKKFGGHVIEDLGKYLRDYLSEYPNTSVYVGTDSQNAGRENCYVTVVALYDEDRKDGVHYIFAKTYGKRIDDTFLKMWEEVEKSLEVANYLEEELEGYLKRFSSDELLKIKSDELRKPVSERDLSKSSYGVHQTKLVGIDVDVNPDFGGGRNKSNTAYIASKSYLTGFGYRVRYKPHAWSASCAADFRLKRKKRRRPHKKKKST